MIEVDPSVIIRTYNVEGSQKGQGEGAEGVTPPLVLNMGGPCAEKCDGLWKLEKARKRDSPISTKKCGPTGRT